MPLWKKGGSAHENLNEGPIRGSFDAVSGGTRRRGAAGGYQLAKPASVITVLDVLRVTEGSLAPASCLEDDTFDCNMAVPCMELGVWRGLYKVINEYLGGITLQSIIDEHSAVAADSYSI